MNMRKAALILAISILLLPKIASSSGSSIRTNVVFDAVAIGVGGTVVSQPFDLSLLNPEGYFSIQIYLNDTDADVDVWYEISNDGENWAIPLDSDGTTAGLLFDDFLEDGGTNSDGREIKAFGPVIGNWIRFKAQEATVNNAITGFTATIAFK